MATDGAAEEALWLGLDTGGTYTDAVLLAGGRRVIASAKSLTTHWDLAVGVREAIRSVLNELSGTATRRTRAARVRVDDARHQRRGRESVQPGGHDIDWF